MGVVPSQQNPQNELPNVENEIKTQNPQWVLSNVHKNGKKWGKNVKNYKVHYHGSLESENGGWRKVEDEVCGWCMDLQNYLQNCHYDLQNYKNATHRPLMLAHSLKWRGNDVEMMWQLSSTEYWCPSSKIASPKYLKIIKNKN